MQNCLLSASIAIADMDDINEVKNVFKTSLQELGIDVSHMDRNYAQEYLDRSKANREKIEAFVQTKLQERKSEIKIISEINYDEAYKSVNLSLTLIWLGILLDNALDASVNSPIIIKIISNALGFKLEVSNEYAGESQNIELIFARGYTTKKSGSGIGLHNLYKRVTELGGTVDANTLYTEVYNCQYIIISINFRYNSYEEVLKE
jgi:sensor histidine kinase regulating citrate/malate metabolism